jgi:hypothetical protein
MGRTSTCSHLTPLVTDRPADTEEHIAEAPCSVPELKKSKCDEAMA